MLYTYFQFITQALPDEGKFSYAGRLSYFASNVFENCLETFLAWIIHEGSFNIG
jgi:hypothetical protein